MSLPLYLAPADRLRDVDVGAVVVLDGAEGRHAATVRRTQVGEGLRVADGAGRVVVGEVLTVGPDRIGLRVSDVRDEPEPSPRFVLVQALAKGERDLQAIAAATECGVDEVVPWQAQRCIVRWRGERGERSRRKWDDALVAATKQSRRARRPVLAPAASTAELAGRVGRVEAAYVLHEDAEVPLACQPLPASGEVLLVVGPEGGIGEQEQAALTGAGARAVRLGPSVLRSSTAGPAALAVLSAVTRWR